MYNWFLFNGLEDDGNGLRSFFFSFKWDILVECRYNLPLELPCCSCFVKILHIVLTCVCAPGIVEPCPDCTGKDTRQGQTWGHPLRRMNHSHANRQDKPPCSAVLPYGESFLHNTASYTSLHLTGNISTMCIVIGKNKR